MRVGVIIAASAVCAALAAGVWQVLAPDGGQTIADAPARTAQLAEGAQPYETWCARCHGTGGVGTDAGPPLVHKIYEPGHHGDLAFLLAARNGVRAHHWRFGNMPPVEGVSDAELARIVDHVRALQRAAGIF